VTVEFSAFEGLLRCKHQNHLDYSIDLSELWRGAPPTKFGTGSKTWKGGFRGRPELAKALWGSIVDSVEGRAPKSLRFVARYLRSFYRFLDQYENAGFTRVDNLSDISSELSIIWQRPIAKEWSCDIHQSTYSYIGKIIRSARLEYFGLGDIFEWHSFQRIRPYPGDLPNEKEVRKALTLLKHTAYKIFDRWKRADRLALEGRNILDFQHGKGHSLDYATTEADAHTSYRVLIERTGSPLPGKVALNRALGLSEKGHVPKWWPRHDSDHPRAGKHVTPSSLEAGLYPTLDDIDCLSQLFMARTGWNPSTVYNLDIGNPEWARPHGDEKSNLWIIESFKVRSADWQWTIASGRVTSGPYAIVCALLERTRALRDWIAENPKASSLPRVALRSPWIARGDGMRAGRIVVRHSDETGFASTYWKRLVSNNNSASTPEQQVPTTLTPSDWRDIFASRVFVDSRYSWVMVQWALGHKHVATTRLYLRKILWRRYSEKKLSDLQVVMIDGIEAHARIDATIIRAKLEYDFEPSSKDLDRLNAYRETIREEELTYSGYRCGDPNNPPLEIDPSNPGDGSVQCVRGDRCPGCPIAQAVDSWHMAKRLAELRWLRSNVSATIWAEAQYASDLTSLEADLKQWPIEEVASQTSHWETLIASGSHKVLRFGARL